MTRERLEFYEARLASVCTAAYAAARQKDFAELPADTREWIDRVKNEAAILSDDLHKLAIALPYTPDPEH